MPRKNDYLEYLSRDERLNAEMTGLCRSLGFERYRMGRFESYEIYLRHNDYVDAGSIITLPGPDGKLAALRPDVTLSLINNLPPSPGERKFFYDERVYRRDRTGEYRELHQLGAEHIGGEGAAPECGITLLALNVLALIGGETVLSLGHNEAVGAMMDEIGLDSEEKDKALGFIADKAMHSLRAMLGGRGEPLISLVSVEGSAVSAVKRLRGIVAGTAASRAVDELSSLVDAVESAGLAGGIRLDMSLIDNPRYYNGLVMRGYLRGAAGAVLTGGRYDNILGSLGRSERAVGFALDFGAVARAGKEDRL